MLSIIVSWRDRDELSRTLPLLLQAARLADGDVTVVNYSGSERQLSQQLEGLARKSSQCVFVSGEQYFNKARAQNIGAGATTHPVLFFCDCDILVEPALIADLAEEVRRTPQIFATLAGVVESEHNSRLAGNVVCFGYQLDIRVANGRRLRIIDNEEDVEHGTRQAPGLLLTRRDDFLRINGYNGQLHGWGWEDQDMIARLTLGAGLTRIQRGVVTHLSHGDAERIAHYPPVKDRWESRDRMFRQALANYDIGEFSGTYRYDNERLAHSIIASGDRVGAR
jgi:hypothetical protein